MPCRAPQCALKERRRCRRREHWRERAELLSAGPDGRGELLAPSAVAQMGADTPPAQHPAVSLGDPATHIVTSHRASLRQLEQCLARFEDRLFGATESRRERDRDLLVGEAAELPH